MGRLHQKDWKKVRFNNQNALVSSFIFWCVKTLLHSWNLTEIELNAPGESTATGPERRNKKNAIQIHESAAAGSANFGTRSPFTTFYFFSRLVWEGAHTHTHKKKFAPESRAHFKPGQNGIFFLPNRRLHAKLESWELAAAANFNFRGSFCVCLWPGFPLTH